MKILRSALTSALLLSSLACAAGTQNPAAPEQQKKATVEAPKSEVLLRGEPLKGAPKVEFAALMKNPDAHAGKTVQVEANVRKACSKKGCWMELAEGAGEGAGVRVTFKDYGFFVPLDAAGSKAVVEGTVKVAELSEGTARHFEKEGATIPRGADGKAREVQLVATGVELRR